MCTIFNHKKCLNELCVLTSTKISETPLSRAGTSRLLQHTIRICEKEKVNERESNEGNKDRRKRDGREEGWKEGKVRKRRSIGEMIYGRKEENKEGRKGKLGRKERRKEGRKEGRKQGRKEGRKEGRKQGRKEGRKEGKEKEVRKE